MNNATSSLTLASSDFNSFLSLSFAIFLGINSFFDFPLMASLIEDTVESAAKAQQWYKLLELGPIFGEA